MILNRENVRVKRSTDDVKAFLNGGPTITYRQFCQAIGACARNKTTNQLINRPCADFDGKYLASSFVLARRPCNYWLLLLAARVYFETSVLISALRITKWYVVIKCELLL